MIRRLAFGAAAAVLACGVMADEELKIGDAAPSLTIKEWVKGDAVTGFEAGRVYVVEFWATWCGPCKTSIPHLSALQDEYKDRGVTFIGMTSEDPNNSLEQVRSFVKEWNERMEYTVAFDEGRTTNAAYMKAAKQGGIPTAFIVDQESRVVWIGHPMYMDPALELVVDRRFDLERYAELQPVEGEVTVALRARDYPAALEHIDALLDGYPELFGARHASTKFSLLMAQKQTDEAMAFASEAVERFLWDNASGLNSVSWAIATAEGVQRDLNLALRAAERAVTLSEGEDSNILDTLARVYFERGDVDTAIEWQRKAVANSTTDAQKKQMEETLKEYESARGSG
ncbi:MAG: redoxin family protein [Phycisphaeraceae bacterium]|nr:redoxin family protein [Phycisphaeraceae bacterium]